MTVAPTLINKNLVRISPFRVKVHFVFSHSFVKTYHMKNALVVLFSFCSLLAFTQKHSFMLTKVITSKHIAKYFYQDGDDLYLTTYKNEEAGVTLNIIKNKRAYFSLTRGKKGKLFYTLGSKGELTALSKESYKVLPTKLRIFLAYQEADQQQFQAPFGGDVSGGVNNGIPDVLGAEDTTSPGGSGSDCKQTGSCSCGDSTVTVTCGCGGVISCYERTTMACDTDSAGNEVNCREVTGCAGRCDH